MQYYTYDAENLIEQVKRRPGIWHYEDPDYKLAVRRTQLWVEVVHELLGDVKVTKSEIHELVFLLQKKFKGMKDSYHRYILGYKKAKRPYMYSGQLQFLLKNYDTSKLDARLTQPSSSMSSGRMWSKKRRYKLELMSGSEVADETNDDDEVLISSDKIKVSKSSDDDDNDQQSDDPKSDSDEYVAPKKAKTKPTTEAQTEAFAFASVDASSLEEDSEKMFLLSMLPHFRAIPERSRLQVKLKLMQVLLNAAESDGQSSF